MNISCVVCAIKETEKVTNKKSKRKEQEGECKSEQERERDGKEKSLSEATTKNQFPIS